MALMDGELLMETMGKCIVPTSKVQIATDIDDPYVPVRASPEREIVKLIAL
jgi:hypothetical protein